jgi:hypothetical protein
MADSPGSMGDSVVSRNHGLIAALLLCGCRTQVAEIDYSSRDYMPGYRISIPRDLPNVPRGPGKDGKEFEIEGRYVYETTHAAGWRECFQGYRAGDVDLSKPCPEAPDLDPESCKARGRRDGFEECRRLLLKNGNR